MIISDPNSYYYAWKDPRWQVAMDEEMNSLQKVELVKEKTAEFPSYSTEYLDDEIGGDDSDFEPYLEPMIFDISDQQA